MKRIILTTVILTTLATAAHARKLSEAEKATLRENSIATVQMVEVTNEYPQLQMEVTESAIAGLGKAAAVLDAADVIVDKVINIGTKIWNVVAKGEAVYNFNRQTATGLPQGAARWDQLQNWQNPTSRVYSITANNIYGYEILRFDYRVLLLYGGSVGGVGRYIGYASVQPATVTIPYLTIFDVTTKVESVYNKGTKSNPVAGMILTVNIAVQSKIPLVSKRAFGYTYYLDGAGQISAAN
jgi:hypothetical protein